MPARNTVTEAMNRGQVNLIKWKEMVGAFVAAGVPLKIFRNQRIRNWIGTNVQNGSTLPSETRLRELLQDEGIRDLNISAEKFG